MQIYAADQWVDKWDEEPFWAAVIDLRPCSGETELIRACASVLHGSESAMGGMTNEPNLNWMEDVCYDWFVENWGPKKQILIAGGSKLFEEGHLFALEYVAAINDSFLNAVLAKAQAGDSKDVAREILETSILLVLN